MKDTFLSWAFLSHLIKFSIEFERKRHILLCVDIELEHSVCFRFGQVIKNNVLGCLGGSVN